MKKTTVKLLTAIAALALLGLEGCTNDRHAVAEATEPGAAEQNSEEYFGARFKEGKGVELADQMKKSLNLETIEVKEEPLYEEAVPVIPASSLLETIEGTFVYVVNGKHFLRTAVTVGRSANDKIEITDGLYPGDEVVRNPVRQLWYAELQALRGGKACADGH